MRVRQLVGSGARRESYTVIGDDGRVVEEIDDFLAMCTDREYSPNTIRARAYDLLLWLRFLAVVQADLQQASAEHIDQFAGWLRRPVQAGRLVAADTIEPRREATTVNRALDSVYVFYEFEARRGNGLAAQLVAYRPVRATRDRGFLAGIAKGEAKVRPTKLKTPKLRPPTLTDEQLQAVLEACTRLRDRFLIALMFETGCRIGQALGLRHEDISTDRRAITLVPREGNANRARGKSRDPRQIPVRQSLCDLYVDYLFAEYGDLDSDYVFVNLWDGTVGQPMTYWGAMSLVLAESYPNTCHEPHVLDRRALERYIGWLISAPDLRPGKFRGKTLTARTRKIHLSTLKGFLEAWGRYGWSPRLPDDAYIYVDDLPRASGLKANFIDEYLMQQIEADENLALLDAETRTMVLICRDEGLRIGEALTLKTDCLRKLPSGRWALVHYKSKDKSYRAIPASAAVVDAIQDQVAGVRERFNDKCVWLFPGINMNPDGDYFISYSALTKRFDAWLERIHLVDASGRPATVNWHQFRHTLGTRMANAGVSGRTIREVLGHTSWEMQEHYSRIADETVRREYEEKYEVRFNRKGQAVRIHPDADLGGVEWLADKIGRRLHAVAGGWCGRHIARACPENAAEGCYFCEDFQTSPDQLHIHQDTLERTLDLQSKAEQSGRSRVAKKNAEMADAIRHIIDRVHIDEANSLDRETEGTVADAS